MRTGNHPWFPTGHALKNAGNPQLVSLDPGFNAQGRLSPHGTAFGNVQGTPARTVPHDTIFGSGVNPSPMLQGPQNLNVGPGCFPK